MVKMDRGRKVPEEQIIYADILYYGGLIGIIFMAITFAIYVSGTLPSLVKPEELTELWTHDTHYYLEETGLPTGWGWINYVTYGDVLNFVALAFLAMITIICYLAIIPVLLKKKDIIYTILAIAEVIILLLAASGLLQAGH
ncbi:predicted coding region AF_1562 [Archaeoglobus fulgidus DSM 4304]|uniref:Uncharacterized protein AF_1562 n=3 Tax=Archaeoglobus fulgidus TaxID=2234 RepID=Y1562_ARCFU|nr:RecName: Full=Uncharacterized protein AF_1562 [Archaeoglobus fulgidus DSM 4304]AAB89687.1 predicted coding region AF_1562 [Archaeoglobus fulgidus DSM 4304]